MEPHTGRRHDTWKWNLTFYQWDLSVGGKMEIRSVSLDIVEPHTSHATYNEAGKELDYRFKLKLYETAYNRICFYLSRSIQRSNSSLFMNNFRTFLISSLSKALFGSWLNLWIFRNNDPEIFRSQIGFQYESAAYWAAYHNIQLCNIFW